MSKYVKDWETVVNCLWHESEKGFERIPGGNLLEWLLLLQTDYDEVDRLYVEAETIGGG